MNRQHWMKVLALCSMAALLISITGCSDDDTPAAPTEDPITVDVFFDVNVSGQPLQLNSLIYTNEAGTKYSIKTLRFVISDVTLHAADGTTMELADLHYYTIADAATQSFRVYNGIPHKDWDRVTFTFGLDETKNVRDKYIDMFGFHQDMAWPIGMGASLGYHYMQLEGNYETTPGVTAGYTTHTGAHQLASDPVPLHYFINVEVDVPQTHIHEGGLGELTLHFDLNGWYKDHNLSDGDDTLYNFKDLEGTMMGQMIMGNKDAQTKLMKNGPFCFSATLESSGGHDHAQ